MKSFSFKDGKLHKQDYISTLSDDFVWLDMLNPTADHEKNAESYFKVDLPTREDMKGIETSNRLYKEDGALFMTANLLSGSETDTPQSLPVTFVLINNKLVTIRYSDPSAFRIFQDRCERTQNTYESGENILLGLLEVIIDRLSDPLEDMAVSIDKLSQNVFQPQSSGTKPDFHILVRAIGQKADLNSKVKETLVSLDRLITFLCLNRPNDETLKSDNIARLKSLEQDIRSLTEHAGFQSNKINFLLQAALGMISIEQNMIIKFFSVAAVIFLPPTLIASVYGMNFEHMPELGMVFGYPSTIVAMLLSAILPYVYFRHKGWL